MQKQKPNLFDYATSELSQDAFLCWLADWANYDSDSELNKTAKQFINYLIGETIDIKTVTIEKQKNRIDVLLIVNNKIVITIEDKIKTDHHGNQLDTYKKKCYKALWQHTQTNFDIS